MQNIRSDTILILDFGSQYSQLIARRIRELGFYTEVMPWDASTDAICECSPKAIILSGGPDSVYDKDAPTFNPALLELKLPILGICYGMQLIAHFFGAKIERAEAHEYGKSTLRLRGHSNLFNGIQDFATAEGHGMLNVWMSHGDQLTDLPAGFKRIANSETCPIAAMQHPELQIYGLQFHPEVTHTPQGGKLLERFVSDIVGASRHWNTTDIIDQRIKHIRRTVQSENILLALSGGVDSSVVAMLLHRAIGTQLTCIFVDHGLLRLHEGDDLMRLFAEHFSINVIRVDASERFMKALAGVSDPEQKRKIIGNQFIEVFEEQASQLQNQQWLAQGTIYPDVIESAGAATQKAKLIKSHHNVAGLPEDMTMSVLEPIRDLFKDEVRRMGEALGLPKTLLYRHPFPGPGLGVRILGEVKLAYADILRKADAIFLEELHNHKLYDDIAQAFAVFLPVKSVGVVGDYRRHEYVIALRAVETIDYMTARAYPMPFDILELVSSRIINEIPQVSRVTYDISSKPPATIEWE